MISHLIGNGKSNCLYEPSEGTVYACNVPTHTYDYDYISIIDIASIRYVWENDIDFKVPILCTENVHSYAIEKKFETRCKYVFDTKGKPRFNSGHHTVKHILKDSNILGIHLWGMDSMFSNDLSSQMDAHVPRKNRPPLNRQWHPHWLELINSAPNVLFTVHIPKGNVLSVKANNLQTQYH